MNKSNQNFPKCPICSKYAFMPLCESNGYDIFRCVECACDFVWKSRIKNRNYFDYMKARKIYEKSKLPGRYDWRR